MALEYDITGTHRTNYLLSIGINEYAQDAIPNLNNARLDAETFSKILTEKYLFESSNTTLLLDKDATREKIIDHLEAYEEKLTEQDNLIIFFSGHGEMKRGGKYGFWVPHDAEKKPSKYVSNERIKGIIDGIKAHHIYLIVDACFSGTMILKKIDSPENELFEKFSSRMALTSGRKEYVSDGWKGEHSPFFKRLKSILENPPKKAFSTLDLEAHVLPDRFASSNQSPLAGPLNSDDHNWGRFVFYSRDLIKREEPTHTKFNDLRRPRAKDYKKIIKELREEQFISAYTQAIYDVYIELKLNIHIEAFTAQIQSYFDLEKDRQVKENLAEW
ncbi:MAG: caspase family protein, partial [Bacteroidota bacterium]